MALGRNLLGVPVPGPQEVVYIDLEEPAEEMLRRVYAVCQRHRIDPKELEGKFFYQSGSTIRWSPRRWNVARSYPATCRTLSAYCSTMS